MKTLNKMKAQFFIIDRTSGFSENELIPLRKILRIMSLNSFSEAEKITPEIIVIDTGIEPIEFFLINNWTYKYLFQNEIKN